MRSLWGVAGFLALGTLVACSQSFGAGRSVYNEHCVMARTGRGMVNLPTSFLSFRQI